MSMNEILTPGQNAANSSDIVIAAGSPVTIALLCRQKIPAGHVFRVKIKCGGGGESPYVRHTVGVLTARHPVFVLNQPGTYFVSRPDISDDAVDVGVGQISDDAVDV
jgi:hypothetical protein